MRTRRSFISAGSMTGAMLLGTAAGVATHGVIAAGADEKMSPNEDLMQEHALLNRVLLIYEEAIRRLQGGKDLDPAILLGAAEVIRRFVEQYHEKLEEDYVFPRFEKAKKLVDLVTVLRQQHKAGRAQTEAIIALATGAGVNSASDRQKLIDHLHAFIRMYRPHEAREGSVLFPAFRELIPPQEFADLGELFERKEHEVLGADGFEGQVEVVAGLERKLGLYDLTQFTPA